MSTSDITGGSAAYTQGTAPTSDARDAALHEARVLIGQALDCLHDFGQPQHLSPAQAERLDSAVLLAGMACARLVAHDT